MAHDAARPPKEQDGPPGYRGRRAAREQGEYEWANVGVAQKRTILALLQRLKSCDQTLLELKQMSYRDAAAADAAAAGLVSAQDTEALVELEAESNRCVARAEETVDAMQLARRERMACSASYEPATTEYMAVVEEALLDARAECNGVEARCAGLAAQLAAMSKEREKAEGERDAEAARHTATREELVKVREELRVELQARGEAERQLRLLADYPEIKARASRLATELAHEQDTSAKLRVDLATNETARLDLETELELTRMKVQMILAQRSKIDAATRDL